MTREFLSSPDIKVPLLVGSSAGSAGQVLTSQGASAPPQWATPSSGAGGSTPSTASINVDNTTTERSILTYALPISPAVGTIFRFNVWGTYLNNSGAARTIRLLFKLGATTLFDTGTNSLVNNAARRQVIIQGALGIDGASTQVFSGFGHFGPTTAWGLESGFFGDGVAAESLATAKNFTVSVIHGIALSTVSLISEMSNVDRITP